MKRKLASTAMAIPAAFVRSSQAVRAGATPEPWPVLGRNAAHSAYGPHPSASTANTLGLKANLRAADISSPVAAYNATLQKSAIYCGEENGDVFALDEANPQQL